MSKLNRESESCYRKVPLKNLQIWEPCDAEDASEWLPPLDDDDASSKGYPIRPKWLHTTSLNRFHVIVQPDGALWLEGCLYLFWCAIVTGLHHFTISNIAGDLADMMNEFEAAAKDANDFRGFKPERPTYLYKARLKLQIAKGELGIGTANRKISSMIGHYKWKVSERRFSPAAPMWKTEVKHKRYTDEVGNIQVKEILSTDLTFPNRKSISTGRFIKDGGKLYPIERLNQQLLLDALVNLSNPEMLYAHIFSLTSGCRMQSTLTIRHKDIVKGVGSDSDPDKYALYYIDMGEEHLAETKKGINQSVAVPAWVHHMLDIYLSSTRHRDRAAMSAIKDEDSQYVFLTRTGKPYYVAERDRHLFNFSAESGSAIRQFKKKISIKLKEAGASFTYRFHDLRATFGMNLLEDFTRKLDRGSMNQIQLLERLRSRLNHKDIITTMGYLSYREEHPLMAQAQSDFESHLEGLVRKEQHKYDQLRT